MLHLDDMDSPCFTAVVAILSNSVELVLLVTEKSVNWIPTWTQFLSKDSAASHQTVERSVKISACVAAGRVTKSPGGIDRLFRLRASQAI